jgi:hypothetical protein
MPSCPETSSALAPTTRQPTRCAPPRRRTAPRVPIALVLSARVLVSFRPSRTPPPGSGRGSPRRVSRKLGRRRQAIRGSARAPLPEVQRYPWKGEARGCAASPATCSRVAASRITRACCAPVSCRRAFASTRARPDHRTPTTRGTFSFLVRVTDSRGAFAERNPLDHHLLSTARRRARRAACGCRRRRSGDRFPRTTRRRRARDRSGGDLWLVSGRGPGAQSQ